MEDGIEHWFLRAHNKDYHTMTYVLPPTEKGGDVNACKS